MIELHCNEKRILIDEQCIEGIEELNSDNENPRQTAIIMKSGYIYEVIEKYDKMKLYFLNIPYPRK